jgi:hypothetical protein
MRPILRNVFLALLLLFSQQAAHLHALSHLNRDLAIAMGSETKAGGEKKAPPVGHPVEQCLSFHAVDSVLPGVAQVPMVHCGVDQSVASFSLPLPFAPRIVFDSRAPPSYS